MNTPKSSKNRSTNKSKKQRLAQAATGKARQSKARKKGLTLNQKLLFVSILVIGVICIILGVTLSSGPSTMKELACQAVENAVEGSGANSPFNVNLCVAKECDFDVTLCSEECPFAYESDKDHCPVSCKCAEKGTVESDMNYDENSLGALLDAYAYSDEPEAKFSVYAKSETPIGYWPKNEKGRVKVHYSFLSAKKFMYEMMYDVTKFLSEFTCIDLILVEDDSDTFHVSIALSNRCSSLIGWYGRDSIKGSRYQNMNLEARCWQFETVAHEFFHALGIYHEMSRPDRDQYITVTLENIKSRYHSNFRKRTKMTEIDKSYKFDLDSIMMYGSNDFALWGKSAFTLANGEKAKYYTMKNLSQTDINEINDLYECEVTGLLDKPSAWSEWEQWTKCPKTCGGMVLIRFRTCKYEDGEISSLCEGDPAEQKTCATQKCGGEFTDWGPWGPCTATCGVQGMRQRFRECSVKGGCTQSFFAYLDKGECGRIDCEEAKNLVLVYKWVGWVAWSSLGVCKTSSCDRSIYRTRKCMSNLLQVGGKEDCVYDEEKYRFDTATNKLYHVRKCCDVNQNISTTTTLATTTIIAATTTTNAPITTQATIATTQPTAATTQATIATTQSTIATTLATVATTLATVATPQPTVATTLATIATTQPQSTTVATTTETTTTTSTTEAKVYESVLGELKISPELICLYGKLFVGRFNGDEKDDLLCASADGWLQIHYASDQGTYDTLSWKGPSQFCKFLNEDEMILRYVEDLNADGISDLLCYNTKSGNIEITLCNNGMFGNHIDWRGRRELCRGESNLLQVIDIDGDSRADILCSQPTIGVQTMSINTKRE